MKIIPVIHHINQEITMKNAQMCAENDVYGLFLISMDGINFDLAPIAKTIKNKYPKLKVGVNHLGYTAFSSVIECLNYSLDMCWSDNNIVNGEEIKDEAYKIQEEIKGTDFMFFNSVAFKYQKEENNIPAALNNSKSLNFIPTTSGLATGVAADMKKIQLMKNTLNDYPLAIASGLTPENVSAYIPYIEYGLVATGISKDFHNFDEGKLKKFIDSIHHNK